MQIHARYACTAIYKAARQKKGFSKTKDSNKKRRWLCSGSVGGINEPGGMQNRSGPMSAAPWSVQVALPVFFPAVAVR